jgi:hypothetical protein
LVQRQRCGEREKSSKTARASRGAIANRRRAAPEKSENKREERGEALSLLWEQGDGHVVGPNYLIGLRVA